MITDSMVFVLTPSLTKSTTEFSGLEYTDIFTENFISKAYHCFLLNRSRSRTTLLFYNFGCGTSHERTSLYICGPKMPDLDHCDY